MSTGFAGIKSDAPTVKIEPVKNKDGTDQIDKDGNRRYNVPTNAVQKIFNKNVINTEESKKYVAYWKEDDYRKWSPGEGLVDLFLELNPPEGATIIDWGCGTGRASKKLYESDKNYDISMVDFAFNCLDDDVKKLAKNNDRLRFIEEDLTVKSHLQSEWGFCTDVMEHIPTEDVDKVLTNILTCSKQVFFQISTQPDIFSKRKAYHDDDELHLTVKSYHWWLEKFSKKRCIIHRSKDNGGNVTFFVTAWASSLVPWSAGSVNTGLEVIKSNMEANAKHNIQPVMPHDPQDTEVMLLCGGPTLNDFEDEIRDHRENGVKCITVNGTYNWCIERGIKPSLQCMIDARPFMLRMVDQVEGMTDETKYAISSQCDPSIFEAVPHDRTYMWQASLSPELVDHVKEHYGEMYKDWIPCPGGSTVALRTIMLLRILGYMKIHIYGMDSCVFPDKDHHAYAQEENDYLDEKDTVGVVVGKGTEHEKTFQCQMWQAFQAVEFERMVPHIPDDTKIQVHGDGLIAYLLQTAAKYDVSLEIDDAAKPPR